MGSCTYLVRQFHEVGAEVDGDGARDVDHGADSPFLHHDEMMRLRAPMEYASPPCASRSLQVNVDGGQRIDSTADVCIGRQLLLLSSAVQT